MRRRKHALPAWCRIVRERPEAFEREVLAENLHVRSPRDAVVALAPRLAREEVEVFLVIALNAQHRMIALQEVTRGIQNCSLVHPREVFRIAIAIGAAAIIVAHNHPSGDPAPSADDRAVTEQLVAAGRLLDLPVHDHIIVGAGSYTSFAEAGLL
uniref:Smu18B n=1 Tax=uncultured organism TaxID=155900 RepID=Q0GNI5_9ZZZZ|nr:Smu18B [uncultured organism]